MYASVSFLGLTPFLMASWASICFVTYAKSFLQSSDWIVSRSRTGSMESSTWMTSSLSNARTQW